MTSRAAPEHPGRMRLRRVLRVAGLLLLGLVGALAARAVGVPMPFLLGALAAVGLFAMLRTRFGRAELRFPVPLRRFFVGVIGTMIGAGFTRDLLALVPALWPSMLVMIGFVALALAVGYLLYRHVGRYDPVTAFYAAMPGGLIEAVALGEQAGGNVQVLSLQHFARVVLVVTIIPLLYLMWSGNSVGSAAGMSFETGAYGLWDIVAILGLTAAGLWIGPRLRLPAAHLVGPLVLSAVLHAAGALNTVSPAWMLWGAQLVVGVGLGVTFAGARAALLLRAFGLGTVFVTLVLLLSYVLAAALAPVMPVGFDTLFISFAPGGVTEMGLVALSLGLSPVLVTVHHVFRIGLTVAVAAVIAARRRA